MTATSNIFSAMLDYYTALTGIKSTKFLLISKFFADSALIDFVVKFSRLVCYGP